MRVIIIGSGFAGLTAARYLKKYNIETLILESRKDIGGRIRTFTDWGFPMDLGASWIQSPYNNPLTRIAKKLNIGLFETSYKNSILYDHGLEISKKETDMAYKLYKEIYEKIEDEALKSKYSVSYDYLYEKFKTNNDLKDFIDWWTVFLNDWEVGANLKNFGARTFFENKFEFYGMDCLPTKGMRPIIDYIAKGTNVELNSKVKKISRKNNEILIETEENKFHADYCICTVPIGVLKTNQIIFEPELSIEKKTAIDNLEMGILNKIYTQWDEPWWNTKTTYIGMVDTQKNFPVSLRYHLHDPNTILSFFHGDQGKKIEAMENEDIIKLLIKTIETAIGKKIPKPKNYLITKWGKDKNTLGSYSFFPTGSNGKEMEILTIPENNLFFAGEHTNSSEYGYAQGAYHSGVNAAKKIISNLKLK